MTFQNAAFFMATVQNPLSWRSQNLVAVARSACVVRLLGDELAQATQDLNVERLWGLGRRLTERYRILSSYDGDASRIA